MPVRLITIPFSHYCEKARWALDRAGIAFEEDGHLPMLHYLATFLAGAKRTVPVVVDGNTVLTDSTEIIAWADQHEPGSLLPKDPKTRAVALELEDDFDRNLGPATRRWGYFQLMPQPATQQRILAKHVPRWEVIALRFTKPLAFGMLKRGLNITAEGAERSRAKIDDTLDRVGALLADGRTYLAGDQFSVADLAFASLVAPVTRPEGHPMQEPALELFSGAAREQVDRWRSSPAGTFAQRMYADHR
ncbi:MAG: Glutathione S-transferase family protein [Myxococcales bacterium]|nr:Glutathione S-transferase family protein [Myxococcales bacterium]